MSGERQQSGAAALSSLGTDPVLFLRFCWSGTREGDKPYLQLRNLENVQNHHADGNLLLSIVPYLKPHTGHTAAKAAGSLSQHSAAWGRRVSTTEILGASQCATEVWNNCHALGVISSF